MDIISEWLCKAKVKNSFSDLKKRKVIFEYLRKNIAYDHLLISKIKNNNVSRNPITEFDNVFINRKGICSSISQVYHVLLAAVGVKSQCICCMDDHTPHQLVQFNSTQKFDDLTNSIISPQNANAYFNYSIQKAAFYGQGNVPLYDDLVWVNVPDDWLNYIFSKSNILHS